VGQLGKLRAGWQPARAAIANRRAGCHPARIAASRNEWWRFSVGVAGAYKCGRRIDNPPQVKNHTCPN